jgi:two-component system, cell cycle response regulator
VAYRYGGEEVLIVLPEQSLQAASVVAEGLRRGVEELVISHNMKKAPPHVVTISLGQAALSTGEKRSFEELLKEADDALYSVMEAGRNQVVVVAHNNASVTSA